MNPSHLLIVLVVSTIIFFTACDRTDTNTTCSLDLHNSRDVYAYPDLRNKQDTDFLAYPLKNIISRRDSFIHVIYGTSWLNEFDEPNLSLRFAGTETFRFTLDRWADTPINIRFNSQEMIVKKGIKGSIYPITNEDKLDTLERILFRFMDRYIFRNRESVSDNRKRYYDSMVHKYPELLSVKYYKSLFDKSIDKDSLKFSYTEKRIGLTPKQYCEFMDILNASEFGSAPWEISYEPTPADGGGYTFEANTKGRYKFFVCTNMPSDSLKFTKFCQYLIDFAGLGKDVKL